ncbi:MAG: glycosyltransferase [Bryobacteraceae bacterium]|jgi:cellulose synthase/poly-beta-1,6-N-acetylglucosamine synthase-like glycosyltransferase/peptidoglycan/xylan/chitin deacetylase (PgdA/CDA1 family)/spore germination protein YaaH
MSSTFVFHDPSGRRWARVRRIAGAAGVFGLLAFSVFLLSLFISPQLPNLGLPAVEHLVRFSEVPGVIRGEKAAINVPFKLRKAIKNVKYVRSASPVIHPKMAAHTGPSQPVVFGYYVNWDPASIVSLRLNLQHLTHLVAEWLVLQNGKGDLDDQADPTVARIASDAGLPVLAMVTNFRDGWQAGELHSVLVSAEARANLVDNIYSNLLEHKFAGANIDLEELRVGDRGRMVEFLRALRDRLKPAGMLVTLSVPAGDSAYDLRELSALCDFVVPMVYDEHYQSGAPGPVASQEWFDRQLGQLAKLLPPEKTVIGIGAYGYDWMIGGRGSAEVGFGDVMSAAKSNRTAIAWDPGTENPVLRYTAGGQQHEVWFLDAVTELNQINAIEDAGFRGYGLWRLGAEDPGVWTVMKPETWPTAAFDPAQLAPLSAQQSVNRYGDGEVLRVTQTPSEGRRSVWRRPDGDFAERYEQYPSYYVVENIGKPQGKVLSLTFDDGPDPKYTPAVLDVLKGRGVPASFFVVGVEAEQSPNLLRREYAEGHVIGNHTYSHPNIAAVSLERTRLELAATLRIIEHTTGRSTKLFRPPYNADSEPQTIDEIVPILRAQQAGYLSIGERIDPRDWQPGITVDAILDDVMAEKDEGNIILLHDGGGDRSATVAALPRIIDTLRAQGYRFVSIGDLIGKTRDQLMPLPDPNELRWAEIEGQAFGTKGNFKKVVGILFLWAIYVTALRSLVYGGLAVVQKIVARRRTFDPAFRPPVSVVIAAYDEERVVRKTVESVLANGYPDLEVVVVDDGSRDGTLRILREAFGGDARVRIATQPNGGKASALNHAISLTANEILVAVDADTVFRPGAIYKLVRHFADPRVGAVSGNARVGNREKWITRFQSIEYIYGFNLDRRALDVLNAITVVPGAAGAWRKSLVLAAGGFGNATLAEDADLTLAIRRLGYRIRYDEEAVAYTEAPEDTRSLARQRFRWSFGTLQAAWKHRDATFDPRTGSLGLVALPSIWLFQVLLSVLSPLADLAMVIALFAGNWRVVLVYYGAFFVLELLTGLLAYALEGEPPKDLAWLFFQRVYYRILMQWVLLRSVLYAIRGGLVGWGKLERRASVQGV